MAVTIKGKHHRNPSGFRNKVKWLLRESNYDSTKIPKIMMSINGLEHDYISSDSWYKADILARLITNENFERGKRLFPDHITWIEEMESNCHANK